MQPLANYSTHSIEVKVAFSLFPDSIVVRYSRGVFGKRGEEQYPLTTLTPECARIGFRRDVYITAGGIIGGGSLLLCLRLFRETGIGWLLFSLVAIGISGFALLCIGFRNVEYAQFQTQAGVPIFRVPRFSRDRAAFESFIEALAKQIKLSKGIA
jgi:hypothetical protein